MSDQNKRIKITERGWNTFTGEIKGIRFVNGVSERHLMPHEAKYLGGVMRCVEINEFGAQKGQVGVSVDVAEMQNESMAQVKSLRAEQQKQAALEKEQKQAEKEAELALARMKLEEGFFNRAQLEEIADRRGDDGGISGLRHIGDQIGVKSNSMEGMISGILKAQNEMMAKLEEEQRRLQSEADLKEQANAAGSDG